MAIVLENLSEFYKKIGKQDEAKRLEEKDGMTSSSAPTSSGRNDIWLMALRSAVDARPVEKFLMDIS